MKWVHGARARVRLLFRGEAESRMDREFQFHIDMETDRLVTSRGLDPREARRQALIAFGGVEKHREELRDGRGLAWLSGISLDLKLGVRMLGKSPWLTVVALIALSIAVGGGAAYLEFVNDIYRPTLPLKDGDRIVGILNWNAATDRRDDRMARDFLTWRHSLTSIEHLGAYHAIERNLITGDGNVEPVKGVEISASAFRIVPTPPLLGRPLLREDEQVGAQPVALLGYRLWQSRFGGDPAIVGRTIRLGNSAHTIIGVMPATFGFPVNQSLWVPLKLNGVDGGRYARGEGPPLRVFGRLAAGVAIEGAQAELTAISQQAAAEPQDPGQPIRPIIKPYLDALLTAASDDETARTILYSINLFFVGLLAICGANVATLVFARTATREGEITVRTALGASRGRIIAQLFAEALVLASVAALVGLALAAIGIDWATAWVTSQGTQTPFWWDPRLSPGTVLYAVVLALLAATIIGVVPALKATGPHMQARLKHAGAGNGGMKFGGLWTGVIVAQVALTVIFLSSVVSLGWNAYAGRNVTTDFAFAREEYLSVRLDMDRDSTPAMPGDAAEAEHRQRFARAYLEIERRLEAYPGVTGVTYATHLPGAGQAEFFVEMDAAAVEGTPAGRERDARDPLWVRSASVAPDFFSTFNSTLVAGRSFTAADAEAGRGVVIVDETFVEKVLGGRNPVGLHVRQPVNGDNPTAGPWLEIVGVVKPLSRVAASTTEDAMLYHPVAAGAASAIYMVVHVPGDASEAATTVRSVAAAAGPSLRLYDLGRLDELDRADRVAHRYLTWALAVVSAVALLLSTAGVYSLLSFTLAQRTREIGIRAALGAAPRSIVTAIFTRAFTQVGLGLLAGTVPGVALVAFGAPEVADGGGPLIAATAALAIGGFILCIALLACVAPARRALRIHPTEALRTVG